MSEKITLRPYQQRSIGGVRSAMATQKHILFLLQQGGGKSFVLSFMAKGAVDKGLNTVVLSHRTEITGQNSSIMERLGIDYQVVNPRTRVVLDKKCHVSMAQTLKSRCSNDKEEYINLLKNADLVIIDEAHLAWGDFVFQYISKKTFVVGLTGTPERRGTQTQLGLMYDKIVSEIKPSELVELKHIIPARCFTFQAPKLDNVDWDYGKGDYSQKQISKLFSKPERYGGIIKNWKKHCENMKTIVFTTSSGHCIDLTKDFVAAGVNAKYLLSSSESAHDEKYSGDREKVLNDFRYGDVQVLVNIDIASVGYDNPSIEAVILDLSTESFSNYAQKAGRGCRPFEDQESYVLLDFGGNVEKHGRPEDDRKFSLWHNTGKGGGVPMTKECPKCMRLIHIGYSDCPFCGHHFPTSSELYDVELQELVGTIQDNNATTIEQYVAQKKLKGWSNDIILRDICVKNPDNQKAAFMEAIGVLRTAHGAGINPSYWYAFKKYKLRK